MTVGTGIFLSAVFLGIVLLLISTKDKWTWKALFLYPLLILTVCTGIFGLVYRGYHRGYYGPNKIRKELEYSGVRLRSTLSDVRFSLGLASRQVTDEGDGYMLIYSTKNLPSVLYIYFGKDGLVYAVTQFDGTPSSLKWIQGNDSLESIHNRFGEAQYVDDSREGTVRIYRYTAHNLTFFFSKDGLVGIGIRDYERYPYKPSVVTASSPVISKSSNVNIYTKDSFGIIYSFIPRDGMTAEQQQAAFYARTRNMTDEQRKAIFDAETRLDIHNGESVSGEVDSWKKSPTLSSLFK